MQGRLWKKKVLQLLGMQGLIHDASSSMFRCLQKLARSPTCAEDKGEFLENSSNLIFASQGNSGAF